MELIGPDSVIAVDVAENLDWIAYGAIDQHLRLGAARADHHPEHPDPGVQRVQHRGVHRSRAGVRRHLPDDYRELWGLQ